MVLSAPCLRVAGGFLQKELYFIKYQFQVIPYRALPGGIPRFGKYWVDAAMPLLLTNSLLYGSYNGKVVLQVPGVTKTIVESGVTINSTYPQPEKFEKRNKWYPTKYNIYKDQQTNKHFVTLSDFVKR